MFLFYCHFPLENGFITKVINVMAFLCVCGSVSETEYLCLMMHASESECLRFCEAPRGRAVTEKNPSSL